MRSPKTIAKQQPYLSIVVPVYNENKRLHNLPTFLDYLHKQPWSWELLIVNDGSTDQTLKKLEQLRQKLEFKIISYPLNRGKGYAIKRGMLEARGKYRLFSDIDLSTPISELDKFMQYFAKYDLVIGTRKSKDSQLLVRQPKLRETLGKGFTFLSQKILGVKVSDFTCGFKCFSQKAAEQIFSRVTIERWGFDSEVLFLAHKLRLHHKEVTVVWRNDPLTKVKFPQDIITSLTDLIKVRWNNFRGAYEDQRIISSQNT